MFEDYTKGTITEYKNEVLKAYLKKKGDHELPSDLESPSPSQLRDYSLYVLVNRYAKEDEQMLKSFFDPENKYHDLENSIRKFDLEKFKSLIKFLNRGSKTTSDKNIKLLAWLIDFGSYDKWRRNRPTPGLEKDKSIADSKSATNLDLPTPQEEVKVNAGIEREVIISADNTIENAENKGIEKTINDREKTDEIASQEMKLSKVEESKGRMETSPKKGYKKWMLYTITAAAIAGSTYLFSKNSNPGCMYWANDRYQPISCTERVGDTAIIALDTFKVAHLRKINRPDTLTQNALGKVWYVKINVDSTEFYTAGGFHPIYTAKKLKPVTEYILNKYTDH
jgi:hypothetical protein